MNDTELHTLARKRVAMPLGFAVHLLVCTLVNAGWLTLSPSRGGSWHWGRRLGWGLGPAIHGPVSLLNLRRQGLRDTLVAAEVVRLRARP